MESKPHTSKSAMIKFFSDDRHVLSKVSDSPERPFSKSGPIYRAASDLEELQQILRENNLRGISSTEDDALLVGELDLLVFTCEVEGSNALLAIKAKEEALSQPVEVEGLPPGLTTVGTEDLALCISYQEHCIVTVLNV
jgi:hypothetical protein